MLGQGNVAIDVARILLTPVDILKVDPARLLSLDHFSVIYVSNCFSSVLCIS